MSEPDFNQVESPPNLLDFQDETNEQIGRLKMVAAEHEGQLKQISTIATAIQSSLSAWQNMAIGVAAATGVIIAILATFQVFSFSETSSLRDDANRRLVELRDKVSELQIGQKALPAEISQQMLAVAASLATVRGESQQPSGHNVAPRHHN